MAAPKREGPADRAQAHGNRVVAEKGLLVSIERVRLAVQIHDQQIVVSVSVHVRKVHAHPRLRLPIQIDRTAHHERGVLEAPAAAIHPHLIRRAVVGDEHVDPAVTIHVARDNAEAVAHRRAQPARSVTSVNVPFPLL
jgi:hypothetical protein